ncbi:TPA: hypothetical protein QHR34_003062 [Raoultella ornithinolytica]|nr:hypothetical protein [Raoultella ornithinolytica]HDT1248913.1 hypothetical protein [Raoultella ornithinolytica]
MKTTEPIPTLALDDLLSMAASAIEDLLEHTDPNTSYYSGVWADVPGKLRAAAMLQAGNSPVIPDGWTGNDKVNAALMMLDRIETVDPVDDDRIDGIKHIIHELAAAPQEVKGE